MATADITYVCGYWNIPKNTKHSYNDHYLKLFPKTFKILKNCNIVFFYEDDKVLNDVKSCIQSKNVIYVKLPIVNLPTYALSHYYLNSCKSQNNKELCKVNTQNEKGLIHYNREYIKSGEDSFRKVFTVWTSKLFLIEYIIKKNPYETNMFSWIDASVSRFNRNTNLYTKEYLSTSVYHFGNNMKYYGTKLPINASFLLAHKNIWEELIFSYKNQLELNKNSNYAHDEETILYLIWKENRKLFFQIRE